MISLYEMFTTLKPQAKSSLNPKPMFKNSLAQGYTQSPVSSMKPNAPKLGVMNTTNAATNTPTATKPSL